MTNPTPPDSYWMAPEPSDDDLVTQADKDLDMLVAEWADGAEVEVHGHVVVDRFGVGIEIESIARDGEPIFTGPKTFEDVDATREWLEQIVPLPDDY